MTLVALVFFGGRPRGRGGVLSFEVVALVFFGGRPRGRGVVVVLTVVDVDKRVEGNAVLLLLVPPSLARFSGVAVPVGLA